ncbi:MAG: amidohydrolase [Desulfobacula sp.]|jgi:omega-amidase|nr:amidohydrolase [Desulfobacula sp.]
MQDLNISLIQTELAWEDANKNIETMEALLTQVDTTTDLVVLPEMFTTGFTMNASANAQAMDGPGMTWMKKMAEKKNVDITGSMIIKDGERFFNRLVWAKPSGKVFTYDKKHLFRYAGEHKIYTPGETLTTIELKGWKLRPFICYDLRFPLWVRNMNNQYDAAVFIANWPRPRSAHWRSLLTARAIENQAYVIGVNRIGIDGNGHAYSGDSTIIDPLGKVLVHLQEKCLVQTVTLSWQVLEEYRKTFPAWMDADMDMINHPL